MLEGNESLSMSGLSAVVRFPAMLFGENHMNYSRKMKVISLALLASLAFSGQAVAQGDYVESSDTLKEIKVWGGENIQASDDQALKVEVVKDGDMMQFHAESSEINAGSGHTVTWDIDSDGTADYQVQYKSGSWQISYVQEGSWTEFTDMPSDFDAEMGDNQFTVEVPVSELGKEGRDYKYGMQINLESGNQFLFPDGDALWYNGESYISSDHYQDAEVDNFEKDTTIEDDTLGFGSVIDMVERFFQSPSNFIKDWVRDTQASEERVDDLEERVNRLELDQRSMEKRLDQVPAYNETEEPSKVELAQQMMFRNNLSEVTVEEDGQTWMCELSENHDRFADASHQVTCITGN